MDIHLDNIKNKINKGKLNNFKVRLQYFLPKHLLTRLVGVFAGAKMGKFTTWCIKKFIDHYNVNTAEMEDDIESFETFNDFFSRPLKNYTRPIDKDERSVVFPSDGRVSQFGDLTENIQLQAKGHYFTVDNLLGSEEYGNYFRNGKFATVYLSPRDYHRVHIPVDGILQKMIHIPGDLFSVNPLYVQNIPELYAHNERVVCIFETPVGKMAVVLVGATIVRSISTVWCGTVAPNKSNQVVEIDYQKTNVRFKRGEEIAKFTMGSTVICLFEKDKIDFAGDYGIESRVHYGNKMAIAKDYHKQENKL